MRKYAVVVAVVAAAVLVPVAVWAAGTRLGSDLERQTGRWTTSHAATSSRAWRDTPSLRNLTICSRRAVTAMLGVTLEGARAHFRVIVDTPEAPMHPSVARFDPDGKESFSFLFVRRTGPFEADDTHSFTVQWRSPSGGRVMLTNAVLNLLYERGTQGCP
jgi:hypothetical protein